MSNNRGSACFTGYIEDQDIPLIYGGASVFLFPSLYEGFGMPVLEAMACGVPVITSDQSALPEVVGDAGLLVAPKKADALMEAMAQLLQDSLFSQGLSQRGVYRARKFTWQQSARRMLEIYKELGDS